MSFMDGPKGKIKSSKESTSLSEKPTTKIVPGLNWVNQSSVKAESCFDNDDERGICPSYNIKDDILIY